MPYEWVFETTAGAARLARKWVEDPLRPGRKPFGYSNRWGDVSSDEVAPRGSLGMSLQSRNRLRYQLQSLPWEMLGDRLAMLSLTYPGDWRAWVPDGRVWDRHRRSFLERWRRRYGPPMGVWVKEFQESGRPHLHLYLPIPDEVSKEDYEGLRRRTLLRKQLERKHGKYDGRSRLPAIGGEFGGDFAMWLRDSWSEVVGTQGKVRVHHARGVDVAVSFWTDAEAHTRDRVTVAKYLAGESAKFAQKSPPAEFSGVGRYWGPIGKKYGFVVAPSKEVVSHAVAYELEHRMTRLVRARMLSRYGKVGAFDLRRQGSGVTALDVRPAESERLLRWATEAAERKNARRVARGEPEDDRVGANVRGHPAGCVGSNGR